LIELKSVLVGIVTSLWAGHLSNYDLIFDMGKRFLYSE